MMLESDALRELSAILAPTLRVDPTQITLDKSFGDDLNLDSMTLVKVVVMIEDHFNALIPDAEWSRFSTVGDLVTYLEHIDVVAPS
jgi:acyl carrier protein